MVRAYSTVGGAVLPGGLHAVVEVAVAGEGKATLGQGRAGDVARQALEDVAVGGGAGDAGVEGEAVGGGQVWTAIRKTSIAPMPRSKS